MSADRERAYEACRHAAELQEQAERGQRDWRDVHEARLVEADAWEELGWTWHLQMTRQQAVDALCREARGPSPATPLGGTDR